jgi:hypothetical protein
MATAVSEVQITLSISPSLTFAFSSQQKYNFVEYLVMNVYQNKWMDDNLVTHKVQFVSIGVLLPRNYRQNMNTGLIPLNSIRFAVAQSMPNRNDPSAWFNPCYSGAQTGMFDAGTTVGMNVGTNASTWEELYLDSAAQASSI